MKNNIKIFTSSILAIAIFGSGIERLSNNTKSISDYRNEFVKTDNIVGSSGSSQGGLSYGEMLPHEEDQAVLDTWFEYASSENNPESHTLGDLNEQVFAGVNYALTEDEDGNEYYIVGLVFNTNNHPKVETLTSELPGTSSFRVKFNSKYWASTPVGGINRMDFEDLSLRDDLDFHAATQAEANEYNDFNGYDSSSSSQLDSGDIIEIDNDAYSYKYVIDGLDDEEYSERWYGNSFNTNENKVSQGSRASWANSYKPKQTDEYEAALTNDDKIFNISYEDWHKYFDEDETTLYGTDTYKKTSHMMFKLHLSDLEGDPNPYDNFGITIPSDGEHLNPVDEYNPNTFRFNSFSSKDALSLHSISFTSNWSDGTKTSLDLSSGSANKYSTEEDERGNQQMLLSYPEPEFLVDVEGYDENNDFIVNVTYDHTPTPADYSIVNYVEYTMKGPTSAIDPTPILWDEIRIGDGWATRKSRKALDDPELVEDPNFYDKLSDEWKDNDSVPEVEGEVDKDGNHVGGYPADMEMPDYDGDGVPDTEYKGDMNIATTEPIHVALKYPDLFYNENPDSDDMKYTFNSKISVTPTTYGSTNAFLPDYDEPKIISYYDEKVILSSPSKPIIETFEVDKSGSWNPDDVAPLESMEITFTGDSKSEAEELADSHTGLQRTGLSTVKVVAYEYDYVAGFVNTKSKVDLSDSMDISDDVTNSENWTYNPEDGSFSGKINTYENTLNPNSNYILALEWVYGEGVYSEGTTLTTITGYEEGTENTDGMFTIKTSSIGDRDVSLTNNTITGIPTPDWGTGDWSLTYTFDYDQITPADPPAGFEDPSFYDRRIVENFEIVNNAGTENEEVIVTKTPEEVKPGFDSMEETPYTGLIIDIPATSLYPDTAYDLTVRANTTDGSKFDSTSIHVDPIDGPPASAPTIESLTANEYYFDKDREIHADIDFSIDAVTAKEAIDSSWTMGPSNIQEVQVINTADDSILASTDGASLNVDENSDGKVNGTITLDGLDANVNYSLELNIVYGAKNESDSAPVSKTFELTTGSRGQAAITATEPVVEGLTTKSFATTATTTLTPTTIGSYDINDFDLPEVSSVELVEYDINTDDKISSLASSTAVTLTDLTTPVDVTIDVPSIEHNSNYKLGVVVNTTDGNSYSSTGKTEGLTDDSGPAEPIVKDLMIQEAEGDAEQGYLNSVFEFDVKTQIYDGIDSVDTSATNLTGLSLTIYDQDGAEIDTETFDESSFEKPSDENMHTQTFTTDKFQSFKFQSMGYNYEINYTYGDGLTGKSNGVIEFQDHGIESLESSDITITESIGMQTGFHITGDINNKPAMFYTSYAIQGLSVLDQDDKEIETIDYVLKDNTGAETDEIVPNENGETIGSFELTTHSILPSSNVKDYSIQIITNENTYSQKLKDIEGVLTEDDSSFVNSVDSEHEVIDELKVGFDTPKNLVIDKDNGKVTFDISFINETSLILDEESINLIDQDGKEYNVGNEGLTFNESSTKDVTQSVTVNGLENGVDYDFTISYDLTDASMEGYSTDTTFTFTQELGSISMPKPDEGISTGAIVGIVIGLLFLLILLPLLLLLLLLLFVAWSARLTSKDGKKASFTTNKKFEKYGELLVGRTLTINDEQYKFKTSENEKGYIVIEISNFNIEKTISKFVFTKEDEKDIKVNVLNKDLKKKKEKEPVGIPADPKLKVNIKATIVNNGDEKKVEKNDNLETLTKKELMDIATETYESDSLKGYTKNNLVELLRNDGIKVPAKNAKASAKETENTAEAKREKFSKLAKPELVKQSVAKGLEEPIAKKATKPELVEFLVTGKKPKLRATATIIV